MFNLFLTISGLVIIINIIYSIIPSEKYANYCKIVIGLITMLAVINIFSGVSDWNFNENYEYDSYKNDSNYLTFDLILKNDLEDRISHFLTDKYGKTIINITVELDNKSEITEIIISVNSSNFSDELKEDVAAYCNIKREKVVIECLQSQN